jgi:hypothetical protein
LQAVIDTTSASQTAHFIIASWISGGLTPRVKLQAHPASS